jgi:hypothetical protein
VRMVARAGRKRADARRRFNKEMNQGEGGVERRQLGDARLPALVGSGDGEAEDASEAEDDGGIGVDRAALACYSR